MATSTCCFCTHLNPAGAKFCNECASPLHLKPCRTCDAVNALDEQACYRCGAVFPVAAATSAVSPESIVAEADETLAALKRELVASAALAADVAGEATQRPPAPATAVTQHAFPPLATQAEPTFDATPLAVPAEDRQWRPERRSRGLVLAMVAALIVVPVAVYVARNPAQLDEWLGRSASPSAVEASGEDATSAAPTLAAPGAIPEAPAAVVSAPAVSPIDAETAGQPTRGAAAGVEPQRASPPSTDDAPPAAAPVESAPSAVDTAAPVASAPKQEAKAAPASRAKAKGSAARARARERGTKPRPQAPPAQAQRSEGQPAGSGPSPRAEPCPEAVAALGLCNR